MTRPVGELLEVLQLCAAVPFAERMDVVDVADDDGRLLGKCVRRQRGKKLRAQQPPMDVGHAGLDVLAELELLVALADLDRAQLAGPVVDVLEQVAMDRAQVSRSKVPRGIPRRLRSATSARSCLSRKAGLVIPSLFRRTMVPG